MSDRRQKLCDLSLHSCNNGISVASPGTLACGLILLWAWTVWDFCKLGLLVGNNFSQSLYLSIKAFATTIDCLQVQHLWDQKLSQVKVIIAFTIKSVSSCFLIHYIYTAHFIVVKLDDVRTRNRCFDFWTLCSSHHVRYHTHTISICCQKEGTLVVVPFAANDVLRIMEITFTPGYFLIFFQIRFDHTVQCSPFDGCNRTCTCQHASTCSTSLMCGKNNMHHFCLWHLLSRALEWRKWKKKQKHQIE